MGSSFWFLLHWKKFGRKFDLSISLLWFKDYFLFQVNSWCMYFKGVPLFSFSKSIVTKHVCNEKYILFFFSLFQLTYSLTTISENRRLSSFLQNYALNYASIENFKTVWTYLTSQETAVKFMNVFGPFAKILRIFCFQKLLWLDNLLPSGLVQVVTL